MADASRPVSSLTVLGGPLNGKRFVWEPGQSEVRIGADPGCHLRLELPGMNAIAARLRIDGSGVTVYDEQSSGGVFVNDDRIPGKRTVRDADVIWLGAPGDSASVMIQCRLAPPPPLSAAPSSSLRERTSSSWRRIPAARTRSRSPTRLAPSRLRPRPPPHLRPRSPRSSSSTMQWPSRPTSSS